MTPTEPTTPHTQNPKTMAWEINQNLDYTGTSTSSQGQQGGLSLEDVETDDPSDPDYKNHFLVHNTPVKSTDDLKFPVVNANDKLDLGDLDDAWQTAGATDAVDPQALKERIGRLAVQEFPDSELADKAREDEDLELQALASDAVKSCAESVMEDNPDMDESTAFAVCQDLENKGQLQAAGRDDDGARQNSVRLHRALEIRNPGDIERIEIDSGAVRYTDIELLAPGVWTDAASEETIDYTAEAIQESVDNWEDNVLNLLHDQNEVSEVGRIDTTEVYADEDGSLYGDIILDGESSASEYAIELMDAALDPTEDSILGGPSVEIVDDETEFDRERGLERMREMWFGGVGLVTNPASRTVAFDNQVQNRAVALAATSDNDESEIRIMERDLQQVSRDSIQEAVGDIAEEAGIEVAQVWQLLDPLIEEGEEQEEMQEDEEEEESEEESPEEEEEEEENEEEMEDEPSVAEQIDNLTEKIEGVTAKLSDGFDDVQEQFEEFDKRLSAIEEEPQQKGLASGGSNIEDEDDGDDEIIVGETPRTTHDGYY